MGHDRDWYLWCKGHGVCTYCHNDYAMVGSTYCPSCADQKSVQGARRYAALKDDKEQYAKHLLDESRRRRIRKQKRRDAGICWMCGKHPAKEGHTKCYECLIAQRRRRIEKSRQSIPREERSAYGMCYICGAPVISGFNVCQLHYDHMITIGKILTEKREAQRKRIKQNNDLIFGGEKRGH